MTNFHMMETSAFNELIACNHIEEELWNLNSSYSQLTLTCPKSTIETLEKDVKYVTLFW